MKRSLLVILAVLTSLALPCFAEVMLTVEGQSGAMDVVKTPAATGFSLSQTYSDVEISVLVYGMGGYPYTGTAYLTNHIGAGTTSANVLAEHQFNSYLPVGNVWVPLFNVSTLDAGNYYVVLGGGTGWLGWRACNASVCNATATTGPGVTYSQYWDTSMSPFAHPYSADFRAETDNDYNIRIYGTVGGGAVPDGGFTLMLLGAASLGMCALRRKLSA